MNKRLICAVLSIVMILGTAVCANADVSSSAEYIPASEMLESLGIYKIDNGNTAITRGEFVQIVSNILNYKSRPSATDGQFVDVTASHANSGAIYNLTQRGIISGYDKTTFKPDSYLFFEDAVKILLSAMGYDPLIKAENGQYPAYHVALASSQDMLDNIDKKIGQTLNVYEASQIIVNALEADMFVQTGFGEDKSYEIRSDYSMMTEYMHLEKIEGLLSDNGFSALTGDSEISPSNVLIGNTEYRTADSNASKFLGYNVVAYVTKEDNGVEEVVYVKPDETVQVFSVPASRLNKDDSDFSATNIVYTTIHGKVSRLKVDKKADFIYNGKAYTDLRTDDLKLSSGKIVLIDNDGNGTYEVVYVYDPQIIVASNTNIYSDLIYNIDSVIPYSIADAEKVVITKEGKEATLSDIKEWDVLMIYESEDGTFIEIEICSEKVVGVINNITRPAQTLGINGEYYHVSDISIFDEVSIGKKYEFCVDTERNIIAVKQINVDESSVAYFVAAIVDEGIEKGVSVKLFTENGAHRVYKCAEKVRIDDNSSMTADQIVAYLNANASESLITFKLNEDQQIREIRTAFEGAELPIERQGDLHMYYDLMGSDLQWYAPSRSFANTAVLDVNVKIIQVPALSGDETFKNYADEDYSVRNFNYFSNTAKYGNFKIYSFGADDGRGDYLLLFAAGADKFDYPIVVNKITKTMNDKGEEREYLYGFDKSGDVELMSAESNTFSAVGIKTGDVIRCKRNIIGDVSGVIKEFDAETQQTVDNTGVPGAVSFNTTSLGYNPDTSYIGNVYYNYNGLVGMTTLEELENQNTDTITGGLCIADMAGVKTYLYDETTSTPTIIPADYNSIYDFRKNGTAYSKLYVNATNSAPSFVVIYQK